MLRAFGIAGARLGVAGAHLEAAVRHHDHLRAAPTVLQGVAEHLAGAETAVMGDQVDALPQHRHRRVAGRGDPQRLFELLARRLQPAGRGQVAQAAVAQCGQLGHAHRLDPHPRIGHGGRVLADARSALQPLQRLIEIGMRGGVLRLADQPALDRGQALAGTVVAGVQFQYLGKCAGGQRRAARAQRLFARAVQCQQAPRHLHALLQFTLRLAFRSQVREHRGLGGRTGQRPALVVRLFQQRAGRSQQARAGLVQAAPRLALLRLQCQHRQVQGDGIVRFLVQPALGQCRARALERVAHPFRLQLHRWWCPRRQRQRGRIGRGRQGQRFRGDRGHRLGLDRLWRDGRSRLLPAGGARQRDGQGQAGQRAGCTQTSSHTGSARSGALRR